MFARIHFAAEILSASMTMMFQVPEIRNSITLPTTVACSAKIIETFQGEEGCYCGEI